MDFINLYLSLLWPPALFRFIKEGLSPNKDVLDVLFKMMLGPFYLGMSLLVITTYVLIGVLVFYLVQFSGIHVSFH